MSNKRKPPAPPRRPRKDPDGLPAYQYEVSDEFLQPDENGQSGAVIITGIGATKASAIIPMPLVKASLGVREEVAQLQRLAEHRTELSKAIDDSVMELRSLGASWGIIGWSLGTSSEAARQHWSQMAQEQGL